MLNHIVIMGRLVADPELRRTGNGTAVASFRVAVDRDYASQGRERKTDFFSCVAWRQAGEFVTKYFQKGSMIVLSGRLEMRDWTDKDGSKRTSAEINVGNVYFGEAKKSAGVEVAPPAPEDPSPYAETEALLRRFGAAVTDEEREMLPF
jgi:single-strand DNA-binding protein